MLELTKEGVPGRQPDRIKRFFEMYFGMAYRGELPSPRIRLSFPFAGDGFPAVEPLKTVGRLELAGTLSGKNRAEAAQRHGLRL